jgi:hypothetical protein
MLTDEVSQVCYCVNGRRPHFSEHCDRLPDSSVLVSTAIVRLLLVFSVATLPVLVFVVINIPVPVSCVWSSVRFQAVCHLPNSGNCVIGCLPACLTM